MPKPDANRERTYGGDMMSAGKIAEGVVLDFLRSRNNVTEIEDVRDAPYWQERDVDFRLTLTNGSERLIDAKSDVWLGRSPNILFEVLRINHTCETKHAVKLGWSQASAAHAFMIWSPKVGLLYQINAVDLRAGLQRYSHTARTKTHLHWVNTDRIKSTLNVLVPIEFVAYKSFAQEDGHWKPVGESAR